MTIEELRTLFCDMRSKDLNPMLCDTEVPLYDAAVPCGDPKDCADDFMESVLMPRELLSMHPEFMVTVRGDSMKDAGIGSGDAVRVTAVDMPYDGDIVLARIEGEYTLKTYYVDEDGHTWLVPQNEAFSPILLDGTKQVKICGRVKEIVKKAPRVATRLCAKAVRKMKEKTEKPCISDEKVGYAIREIAPIITVARLWYAVFRVMVDYNVFGKDHYDSFINRLRKEVPDHEHLPSRVELQRMAIQSFAKPVKQWTADNAPVKIQRFMTYEKIAHQTENLLLKD